MKGKFYIESVADRGAGRIGLQGIVRTGQLKAGMESRQGDVVIVIQELRDLADIDVVVERCRKGQAIFLIPLPMPLVTLEALKEETLLFEDVRSVLAKKALLLKPSLTPEVGS